MKNKSSSKSGLFLMELILSILFFSLSGAICVQLFVKSHLISQESVDLNHAVEWCQNIAEIFYGCNGNVEEMILLLDNSFQNNLKESTDSFSLHFDRDFYPYEVELEQSVSSLNEHAYTLHVNMQEENDMLTCNITTYKFSDVIYELEVYLFPQKEVSYEK